jgi:hypothetical protein
MASVNPDIQRLPFKQRLILNARLQVGIIIRMLEYLSGIKPISRNVEADKRREFLRRNPHGTSPQLE